MKLFGGASPHLVEAPSLRHLRILAPLDVPSLEKRYPEVLTLLKRIALLRCVVTDTPADGKEPLVIGWWYVTRAESPLTPGQGV